MSAQPAKARKLNRHIPELPSMSRRRFLGLGASMAGLSIAGLAGRTAGFLGDAVAAPTWPNSYPFYEEAVSLVFPEAGFQSRIGLGDSMVRLAKYGVIDREKFLSLVGDEPTGTFAAVFSEPSQKKIRLTRQNAGYYVNLLWPVGLATQMAANEESPLYRGLFNYASTGGWTLGRIQNGGAYFNRHPIVELTPDQEARVVRIAKATYRPCCNNSTFFQDCNHGSALLGVLQLGASQGLDEDDLYREALAFNSFWFPNYYVVTALYFRVAKNTGWRDVDPRTVLGFDYSALGPWRQNVGAWLEKHPDLVPPPTGGGAQCGL